LSLLLAFALYLIPPSHELAQPGSVRFNATEPNLIHTRWRAESRSGSWIAPEISLAQAGTYWISAATKARVKSYAPQAFDEAAARFGLEMIADYRKTYKLQTKPTRLLESTYAKTMIRVGAAKASDPGLPLHLPIELILRAPTLLQLNFRGQPIAGVPVMVNGKRLGYTNGAGQLPLAGQTGKLEISASVARAYMDRATADWEVFTATMTLPEVARR
jgi:hypothetical protein